MIKQLLEKKADLRLGSKQGFSEINNHAFFHGINIDMLLKREVKFIVMKNKNR